MLDYIKDCGSYSKKFNNGEIRDQDVDVSWLAYTEDNLYDRIADAIGFPQNQEPEPIPFSVFILWNLLVKLQYQRKQ